MLSRNYILHQTILVLLFTQGCALRQAVTYEGSVEGRHMDSGERFKEFLVAEKMPSIELIESDSVKFSQQLFEAFSDRGRNIVLHWLLGESWNRDKMGFEVIEDGEFDYIDLGISVSDFYREDFDHSPRAKQIMYCIGGAEHSYTPLVLVGFSQSELRKDRSDISYNQSGEINSRYILAERLLAVCSENSNVGR